MSTDAAIEQEIQAKGLNAGPRVESADIEGVIAHEHFFTAADGVCGQRIRKNLLNMEPTAPTSLPHPFHHPLNHVTICVLILKNGTKLVGVNEGPVSPKNFDADMGRKLARQKAVDQVWPLLGYELRNKVANCYTNFEGA